MDVKLITTGVIGGIVGAAVLWIGQGHSFNLVPIGLTYAELSAIALSAASVIVTVLGVGVAILAVWGYSQFKKIAEDSAKSHVTSEIQNGGLKGHLETSVIDFMQREFSDDGKLRRILEARLDQIIILGPAQRAKEDTQREADDDVEL